MVLSAICHMHKMEQVIYDICCPDTATWRPYHMSYFWLSKFIIRTSKRNNEPMKIKTRTGVHKELWDNRSWHIWSLTFHEVEMSHIPSWENKEIGRKYGKRSRQGCLDNSMFPPGGLITVRWSRLVKLTWLKYILVSNKQRNTFSSIKYTLCKPRNEKINKLKCYIEPVSSK